MKLEPAEPIVRHLLEIHGAAERSADLTRQLLAFARKQTIDPRVLNLNATVEGMLKMLRRLIGEDIDLAWQPGTPPKFKRPEELVLSAHRLLKLPVRQPDRLR